MNTTSPSSTAQAAFASLRAYLNDQILGQETLVERLLVALLADGHLLVEGPPGLAKTRAVKALAQGWRAISSACSSPRTCRRPTSPAPTSTARRKAASVSSAAPCSTT